MGGLKKKTLYLKGKKYQKHSDIRIHIKDNMLETEAFDLLYRVYTYNQMINSRK